jgi:autotransporter-associated beta strand protein
MKPKRLQFVSPLIACCSLTGLNSASAAEYTWDGGDTTNANWGQANNWNPDGVPTFDNTAELIFHEAGAARLTNAINGDRIIKKITFNADADSNVVVRTRQAIGNAQLGRVLTFDADSGNATITVDELSAGSHSISGGAVSAINLGGSISLTDSLDVVHSGNGILTLGQNNDGTNEGSETPITGAGGINKSGTGVLALAGPNTFAGGLNVTGGRVNVNNSSALGSDTVTLGDTGAVLRLSTTGINVANALTVSATGDAKTLEGLVSLGSTTFSGDITINEETAGNFLLSGGTDHTLTISGDISGSTAAGVKKTSSGTVVLSGNNTYSGNTEITNGILRVGSATAIPTGSGKGIVLVNSGASFSGTLDLNGNDLTVNALSGGSAASLGQVVNNVPGVKTLTVGDGDVASPTPVTYSYAGLIGANIALKKIGTGIQSLSGTNTNLASVSIENGSLELGNNDAAGPNAITMSAPDTEGAFSDLRFLGSANLTISNPLTISDVGQTKRLRKFGAGTAVYAGNITVNETTEGLFEIQVGIGNTLTITGDISDTGTGGFEKINPGTLILQGAKSYTGTTIVAGGTLSVDTAFFDNASSVRIGTDALLNLTHSDTDTVDKLFLNGVQQEAGVYTAEGNSGLGENGIPQITGTGKLNVLSDPPPADPYASWALQIPTEADRDREDDPDTDGFTNLQEYLFGTSPIALNGSLTTTEKSGTNLVIRWKERETDTDATYTLVQSSTLANDWVTATGATLEDDGTAVDGYQPRKATVAIGSGKLFFRVQGVEN